MTKRYELIISKSDLGGVNVSLAFEQDECTVQEAWTANRDKTIARKWVEKQ